MCNPEPPRVDEGPGSARGSGPTRGAGDQGPPPRQQRHHIDRSLGGDAEAQSGGEHHPQSGLLEKGWDQLAKHVNVRLGAIDDQREVALTALESLQDGIPSRCWVSIDRWSVTPRACVSVVIRFRALGSGEARTKRADGSFKNASMTMRDFPIPAGPWSVGSRTPLLTCPCTSSIGAREPCQSVRMAGIAKRPSSRRRVGAGDQQSR